MYKIAIMGTHGVGKSTLSYLIAAYYKSKGKNVDLIQERIRFSPFPYNENMTESTALWAYHAQIERELESEAKGFDLAVCDRSAIDCFFYARYWKKNTAFIKRLWSVAIDEWMPRYDLVIYIRPDIELITDGIRSEDLMFQKGIDALIKPYIDMRTEEDCYTKTILSSDIFNGKLDIEELLHA